MVGGVGLHLFPIWRQGQHTLGACGCSLVSVSAPGTKAVFARWFCKAENLYSGIHLFPQAAATGAAACCIIRLGLAAGRMLHAPLPAAYCATIKGPPRDIRACSAEFCAGSGAHVARPAASGLVCHVLGPQGEGWAAAARMLCAPLPAGFGRHSTWRGLVIAPHKALCYQRDLHLQHGVA